MEDFEYSVEISDRDWDCFFAQCEECNQLPPSLAGLDSSGMSDIDDTGSILAKRVQKVDLTAGVSEAEGPIDGPPDCEGSPVENYLSKHAIGGMESVLSGSEEDIHLQSINIFFEKLQNLTEPEMLAEPSHVRAGKNRKAVQEEELCSDGQQASSSFLPKNIPQLNSLPASGETAVGRETTEPVDTISNTNTMKKDMPGSNISPQPAASNLVLKTNKSAYTETRLFISEEACTETRVNEAIRLNQAHDSPEGVFCSETTPYTGKEIKVERCTPLENVKHNDFLINEFKCSSDSSSNPEMVANVKRKEDTNLNILQSDASPSPSIKRKRRKKRRLSVEPAESVHGYERQLSVQQSDSEEEQHARRGGAGLCISEDVNLSYLNEPQKNVKSSLTAYSTANNLSVKIPAKDSQYHYLPESIIRNGRCKATGSAENNATMYRSVSSVCQTDNSVMSAPNNSGNVASVSISDGVTGKSDLAKTNGHTECLQQSDKMKTKANPTVFTAEVKSISSILPSAESNDPAVEVSQNDKRSAAKTVLAPEAGNSGRDNPTLCQREAEPQQQLEIDCRDTDQYRSTLEKTHFPGSASSSPTHNTKPKQFKTEACQFLGFSKLISDTSNTLSLEDCLAKSLCSSDISITAQTEHPLVLHTLSKLDVEINPTSNGQRDTKSSLSEDLAASPADVTPVSSLSEDLPASPGDVTPVSSLSEDLPASPADGTPVSSLSEDLPASPADVTPVSSCCTLDTASVMSLSSENNTDMSGSSCLSVNQNVPEGEITSCDLIVKAKDITASEPEKAPDSKPSVFAISSFWSEMEKLTINDILGLRMMSKAAPSNHLPALQESEESDMFAMTDSGFLTQLDESKPEQTNEDTSGDLNSVESTSGSVIAVDSSSSRGVMWESLGTDVNPASMMLTSVPDISQLVLPGGAQTCLRKISKNVSVHNLRALESLSYTRKGQMLQTLDKREVQKVEYFTDGHTPKQDKHVNPSFTDSYRISLTDIFQYLFSGKQSVPKESATDNITTCLDGKSVPETYDHFFSDFDTESFFYPLISAEDKTKDELVPIFSSFRSARRNLQYPEAYDHFFASSSSDDSSAESDEEESLGPVRVVTKFSNTSTTSPLQISTDIYDNFFTDTDVGQSFFWKGTLSFRNMGFTGSTVQKETQSNTLSCVPVMQRARSLQRIVHPVNALGNQDVLFPDPLLYHLEERISRQLAQQPFRCGDLQMAVSNPRLDASFLPLKQSDMCLVCIAFASWVLKTANPQVGDAWKAVLLANVSALSAIGYLRKYVKTAASETKNLNHATLSDS